MSMKPIKRLTAKKGTYPDQQTGDQKNAYMNVGVLMQDEKGDYCVKIEALPVNFDGWINAWDLDQPKQGGQP